MSSPSSARFSVPAPRGRESPRPPSNDGLSTPRSSFDHHGAGSRNGHQQMSEASSSRLSIHDSPVSASSSSRHGPRNGWTGQQQQPQTQPSYMQTGTGGSSSGSSSSANYGKLPRIQTSNVDSPRRRGENDDHSNGPHSAPLDGPLRPPDLQQSGQRFAGGPLRSSSSPEPWSTNSRGASPSHSPIDHRPNMTAGYPTRNGTASYDPAPGSITMPIPQLPTRKSSVTDKARPLTPQSSHPSLAGSSKNGSPSTPTASRATSDGPPVTSVSDGRSATGGPTPKANKRHEPAQCGQCGNVVHGQFVRAMGKVYHLNCFRCKDCGKVVASKFFPVEEPEGMFPLCERDYFARLDLICAKCDQALRSSYITACGNKYHVEHFTCSECDVLFGPNDSYYEHGSKVYCHYHYSTRFAVKCVGCETAILKQFVEMNRNGRDECWHPECYMISKFWNVRLASKNFGTPANSAVSSSVSLLDMTPSTNPSAMSMTPVTSNSSSATSPSVETDLTPEMLKEKQDAMEMKVQQIWHVLSGYEESSAALIGEMLRAVNNRQLLEIILLAERFILYVEVLFAVIDDLEAQFAIAGVKGMSHAREAKHLCRRLVNLLSAMSQLSPNTQDLFTLITQLAHYLKILIRVALTGAIKLERDLNNPSAMANCLARLNLLAMDNGDPTIERRGSSANSPSNGASNTHPVVPTGDDEQLKRNIDALTRSPQGFIASTQSIAYGYRSLAPEITGESTLRGTLDEDIIPPEGCGLCKQPVEENCIRLGMFNRWHPACVICGNCGDKAATPLPLKDEASDEGHKDDSITGPGGTITALRTNRRIAPRVDEFFYEPVQTVYPPESIYCMVHRTPTCKSGFKTVSRLEQYAFLLHIALRRLYVHFRVHHDLPSIRGQRLEEPGISRNDPDVKRVKSVTLDRKISSTARLPQRSTVVESPAGRMANASGQVVSARDSQAPETPIEPSGPSEQSACDDSTVSVDVLRPAFARNNTSVMIINEAATSEDQQVVDTLTAASIGPDDDAITLGDIPLLADQTIRHAQRRDGRILLSTLNTLQSLIVKHFSLLLLQKSAIGHAIELDEVLELLDSRKNQWWNKIFKGNQKKDQKKKGVFGVPIEILVERTGSDSQMGASNQCLRVPEFIEDIVSTMRQMDMAIEGIFRKNGNIRRLQQIAEALDKDSTTVNLSEENPVQLAALLKRWLREMPDPLLTFRLHKLFCAAASLQNREERQRCLHLLITLLPRYNRDTMEVLFVFLKWVGTFSYRDEETGSRMDLANLATVICPSILYAKGANAARDESFIAISVVQDLLENQDEYYFVPAELEFVIHENIFSIFAKELDLPPKEIHRHCSKYMQARGGVAGMGRPMGPVGGGMPIPQTTMPNMRERPSDPRLSAHRSEGNIAAQADNSSNTSGGHSGSGSGSTGGNGNFSGGQNGIHQPSPSTFRPNSVGGSSSRPTSWAQQQPVPSLNVSSLTGTPGWRGNGPSGNSSGGPFQGSAMNGSRTSSRGSAPPSPGPGTDGERRSFQMERDRSWQSVNQEQGDWSANAARGQQQR